MKQRPGNNRPAPFRLLILLALAALPAPMIVHAGDEAATVGARLVEELLARKDYMMYET